MRKELQIIISISLLLMLLGCSGDRLPKLDQGATILAFGDSLTAGVGTNKEKSYPAQLSRMSRLEVINAGVSGETTRQGVTRFKTLVDDLYPDLIILLEGGNDILRNYPESETKANLASMIKHASGKQIPIVLIGVPKKSLFSSSASFYKELADEYQLVLDDESISDIIKSPSLKSDSVHFNQAGYQELAERIFQLLKSNGAID